MKDKTMATSDMELINKLFLELSQVTTATTAREVHLLDMLKKSNDVLRSSIAIARRKGECVDWDSYVLQLEMILNEQQSLLYPPREVP